MGAHSPEVVMARLSARLAEVEKQMADWTAVLGEFEDAVAYAADIKSRHFAEAADAVAPLVASLRASLGMPSAPVNPPDVPAPEQPAI